MHVVDLDIHPALADGDPPRMLPLQITRLGRTRASREAQTGDQADLTLEGCPRHHDVLPPHAIRQRKAGVGDALDREWGAGTSPSDDEQDMSRSDTSGEFRRYRDLARDRRPITFGLGGT